MTGATGFLGRHLVSRLLRDGVRVRVLARTTANLDPTWRNRVDVCLGDLAVAGTAEHALEDVEDIYNCAGAVADWGSCEFFQIGNVKTVTRLLDAARRQQPRRIVHVSTTDVYGYPGTPATEDIFPKRCGLPYADSKLEAEGLLQAAASNEGLSIKIIRPASIYGSGSKTLVLDVAEIADWPMVPVFGRGVEAGLVEVADVVEAMRLAMRELDPSYQVYNVRGPEAVTWDRYITEIAALCDRRPRLVRVPLFVGETLAWICEMAWRLPLPDRPPVSRVMVRLSGRPQLFSIEKAALRLGYHPSVSLTEGLARLRPWLREARALPLAIDGPGPHAQIAPHA